MKANLLVDVGERLRVMGPDIAGVIERGELSASIGRSLAAKGVDASFPVAGHFQAARERFQHAAELGAIMVGDDEAPLVKALQSAAAAVDAARTVAERGTSSYAAITPELLQPASHDVFTSHTAYLNSGDLASLIKANR